MLAVKNKMSGCFKGIKSDQMNEGAHKERRTEQTLRNECKQKAQMKANEQRNKQTKE